MQFEKVWQTILAHDIASFTIKLAKKKMTIHLLCVFLGCHIRKGIFGNLHAYYLK